MSELDGSLLRKLAEWDGGGAPITSISMSVDGRRLPRPRDVQGRLQELSRRARRQAAAFGRERARSVEGDLASMSEFVLDEFERGDTRGLAMFSCHRSGLWEVITAPRPFLDRVSVGPDADLLAAEVVLESHRPTGVALLDHAEARLFVVALGRIEEVADVVDEIPTRHEQGGRAQMRMQRHVDDHRARHVRRVAEALLALLRRRPFEHLVLAGPGEAHVELESELHGYLRTRVRRHLSLPMTARPREILDRVLEIEDELEREREREAVERLRAGLAVGGRAVAGPGPVLEALSDGRVGDLLVSLDPPLPGVRCASCGRLAEAGTVCPACGGPMAEQPDVAEAAVARAFRGGSRVEIVRDDGTLRAFGGIGALVRF